jgi:hypothetical protein
MARERRQKPREGEQTENAQWKKGGFDRPITAGLFGAVVPHTPATHAHMKEKKEKKEMKKEREEDEYR